MKPTTHTMLQKIMKERMNYFQTMINNYVTSLFVDTFAYASDPDTVIALKNTKNGF